MTARRKPKQPTIIYESVTQRSGGSDTGPSFGSVWKLAINIFAGAMTIAVCAVFAWAWNISSDVNSMKKDIEINTRNNTSQDSRIGQVENTVADHTARLAVQAAAVVTAGERLRSIEQQDRWAKMRGSDGRPSR